MRCRWLVMSKCGSASQRGEPKRPSTTFWRKRSKISRRCSSMVFMRSKSTRSSKTKMPVIIIKLFGISMCSQAASTLVRSSDISSSEKELRVMVDLRKYTTSSECGCNVFTDYPGQIGDLPYKKNWPALILGWPGAGLGDEQVSEIKAQARSGSDLAWSIQS